MLKLFLRGVLAFAALALMACGQTLPVQPAYEQPIIRVNNPESARPIQFQRIVIKMRRGAEIGELQEGLLCAPFDTLVYQGGRVVLDDEEFTDAFRDELQSANYRVVGDPDALFDDPSNWRAEYLVAGVVKRIQANICYGGWSWDNPLSKGEAFMEVDWQVYSRLDRQVAFATTTQGSGRITESRHGADNDLFVLAFAQATRNLLADRRFHDLVAGEGEGEGSAQTQSVPAQALQTAVPMPRTKAFSGSIAKNAERVRQGVVTVLVAGGHGSGFFFDDAGHLLTNAHVVRGTDRVKVVLAGGLEATGNVLARDPRRDVALVKVDLVKTVALPLRAVKLGVGAEVYAMGSPLDPSLSATLSKGIVSAYRTMDGLDFIQSDVNVMGGSSGGPLLDASGNVIGMTVSGIEAGDVPMGLNYFIPIGDALSAIGIGKAGQAVGKSAEAEQVEDSPAAAATTGPTTGTSISGLRVSDTSLSQNMSVIQANVATVSVGNDWSHGFFIDGNGHLLTNEHVVRSAKQVHVRLNDGKQLDGRVIAVDSRLNLALVEVPTALGRGLPLRLTKPKLGASVYAVGAAVGAEADTAANRGVIIYQTMGGLQTIKNLASTRPVRAGSPLLDENGNVLGIAVPSQSANEPGDVSYFIPMADALQALGISVAS